MTEYKPGDVANGHVLGDDNQWHPVTQPISEQIPRTYGQRYAARWKWTWIAMGALVALSGVQDMTWTSGADTAASLVDLAVRFILGGAIVGAIVNFAVAAFPTSR